MGDAFFLVYELCTVYSGSLALQVGLGVGVAVVLAALMPSARRLQLSAHPEEGFTREFEFLRRQWKREVPLMLLYLFIQALIVMCTYRAHKAGIIRFREDLVDDSYLATAGLVGRQFAVYFFVFDAYYYALHRFVFHDILWWVHEVHHRTFTPNALTAFLFHPIEAFLTGWFVQLCAYIVNGRMHRLTLLAVLVFGVCNSLFDHAGVQLVPLWFERSKWTNWIITTQVHDLHHARVKCCYGGFTTIYDRLFGTLLKDKLDAAIDRVEAQMKAPKVKDT